MRETKILCPCKECRNIDLHGETREPQVDSQTFVSDTNHEENDSNDDNHRDNLDEMLHDVESNVDEKNVKKLQQLFVDAEKPLCNGSFCEDNKLPVLTYQAKKLTCPMGLEVQRIHACPNDCILYRKDYKDLHECPACMESRYKHKNLTELDSDVTKNGPPAKFLWYLPIMPRLKKLYANPKDAKLLHWHAEERKNNGKIRHVADSPQWKNIDRLKQPGNDIDVYLHPLIDDMIDLWETGIDIYDAYKKERFQLFALIYCTINDFPAYGNLSGYDGVNAQKGKVEMGIRNELEPQLTNGTKMYLPPACYTLSKAEKISFCECLHGVKVPSSYSANIKNLVSMKDLKLLDDVADIDHSQSRHQSRLDRVGTIGRKDVTPTNEDFEQAHFKDPPEPRTKRGINRIHDLPVGESVEFNQFGQVIGKWQYLYGKYIGTRTRRLISILKKNWKQVTKEAKNFLWFDIKAHFRLENDDVKKRTLVSCGIKWKTFKTKLRVKFMPKKWKEERNDPDKAIELHLIPDIRGSNYCLARAPRDKNEIKTLPPELIDVSKNLVQATRELAQGSNESKAGVDPLILVLGPEHKGRTSGVGCDIGYKKGIEGYVRKKRTYEQQKDIEEIRNDVRQQMK
ncbi:transposon protein, CACTA, En/Spm sub-class [Tanacetum coccineum]